MPQIADLFLQLFIIFAAAQVGAEAAARLKMPSVVGEIGAGMLVGPNVLGCIPIKDGHAPLPFEMLAEIGVVFLMFSVGLETRLGELRRIGKLATVVALFGVIVPFGFGIGWASTQTHAVAKQAFIATAFVATSVAITARVLADLNALGRREAKVILAAAVLDDILAMLLLGAVAAFQPTASQTGSVGLRLAILTLEALAFVVALTVFLPKLVRKHHHVIEAPVSPHSPFALSLLLCLGCSLLAAKIGMAGIIGAFLAGTVLAEIGEQYGLEKQLRPILMFLAPYFFVITGMKVDLSLLTDPAMILSVAVVTVLAILGKVIGCGLGAWRLGKREALTIGIGMSPRGEVGIIIAALGLSQGILSGQMYAIIIAMSLLTSIFAPPFLAALLKRTPTSEKPA